MGETPDSRAWGLLQEVVTTWSRLERDKDAYINGSDAVEWLAGFWTKVRALVGPPENMYDADEHPSVEN